MNNMMRAKVMKMQRMRTIGRAISQVTCSTSSGSLFANSIEASPLWREKATAPFITSSLSLSPYYIVVVVVVVMALFSLTTGNDVNVKYECSKL